MLFEKNIDLAPALKLSSWRKIAIGTWRTAADPSVYGSLDLNIEPSLNYLEKLRAKTGQKITLTHYFGKVIARILEKDPQLNCILRFGRLYPRKSIDIFYQVAMDTDGADLSGVTIRNCAKKSLSQIAQEMQDRVQKTRSKGDPDYKKMKSVMGLLPGALAGTVLKLTGFLMYTLNLWTPLLGTPKDPFGSVMITSVGPLGLDSAFAPLVPFSRVPLVLAIGLVKDMPAVQDGKIVVMKTCRICFTFDHRLVDGVHGSRMVKTLYQILENPEAELGL